MSFAVWPSVLLGAAAWAVAAWRAAVLNWNAGVDEPQLVAALEGQLSRGDASGASALCHALAPAWAAEVAAAALRERSPAEVANVLEDLRAVYRQRAQLGIGVLAGLSRIAFPLALAGAIVALSSGFAGEGALTQVEHALGSALQCMSVGVLTSVFCRVSAELLRKQASLRMAEIAAVTRVLLAANGSWLGR